jgi:ketosteroid isomerase-like protein/ribosomal protein L37E
MDTIGLAVDQEKKSVAIKDAAAEGGRDSSRQKMDDFFNQLQSDMRRPDLSQEAVAAAFQEIQRMALEGDVEESANQVVARGPSLCRVCGAHNPAENKFCSACGVPLESSRSSEESAKSSARLPAGQHHYHHHYHHHYFSPGAGTSPSTHSEPRSSNLIQSGHDAARGRSPLVPTGPGRAETAVRKLTLDWMQACNTKHLDDLVDLYTADAMVLRPNVTAVRGAAAIREFFFSALDAGLGEVELESLRTELLGDIAFEAGRCKMLVPVAMGKRREERGKYLIVLVRKSGGEWKLAADCWSSDLSLAAGPEPAATKAIRKI